MQRDSIAATKRYLFERIRFQTTDILGPVYCEGLSTFYAHEGKARLIIETHGRIEQEELSKGEAVILAPGARYEFQAMQDSDLFHVFSETKAGEPVIEIIDDGHSQIERVLTGYKLIKNPKRVQKPWGHELWIFWSKDYYVLKQIGMFAGKQSSLQLHQNKLETNYLTVGEADVIDGLQVDVSLSQEEMNEAVRGIDFDRYKQRMTSGCHWTSTPGIVHRVIAVTDYIAYETSTPELDDVIRLKDDMGRGSGRIVQEHLVKNGDPSR